MEQNACGWTNRLELIKKQEARSVCLGEERRVRMAEQRWSCLTFWVNICVFSDSSISSISSWLTSLPAVHRGLTDRRIPVHRGLINRQTDTGAQRD